MDNEKLNHDSRNLSDIHKSKFFEALELMELGVELMRQNLRRKMKDASEDKINKSLQEWINKSSLIQD